MKVSHDVMVPGIECSSFPLCSDCPLIPGDVKGKWSRSQQSAGRAVGLVAWVFWRPFTIEFSIWSSLMRALECQLPVYLMSKRQEEKPTE